jgi:hypothetical protein
MDHGHSWCTRHQSWHHSGQEIPSGYPAPPWTVLLETRTSVRAEGRAQHGSRGGESRLSPGIGGSTGCSFDDKSVAEIGEKCPLLGGRRRGGALAGVEAKSVARRSSERRRAHKPRRAGKLKLLKRRSGCSRVRRKFDNEYPFPALGRDRANQRRSGS